MIKTSSLYHFEAYEYLNKICEDQLSTHNQTNFNGGFKNHSIDRKFLGWPTLHQWANDFIQIRKFAEGLAHASNNNYHQI